MDIRHVSVTDMLLARDARAARQAALLSRHTAPLISFTMNIAGSVKDDPLIRRAFFEGKRRVLRELERMKAPVLSQEETIAFTGCELLWAVEAPADALKSRMCLIEESNELGRLFDIDVIARDGTHLSRNAERPCLICGQPVRACARSRAHSAEELYEKARGVIRSHFQRAHARRVGMLAQRALLYESAVTPKPGLVDCHDSGAHSDMDLFSFLDSACALRPYFEECVLLGYARADERRLQFRGTLAEDDMFAAAHANTHKGAVFSLGILCYAAGFCGEDAPLASVLRKASETGRFFLEQMARDPSSSTGGERQYRQYGLTGARGEAASGFRSVTEWGLPSLHAALDAGCSLPGAGLRALMALMAHVQDSNVIRRAGMDGQRWVEEQANAFLSGRTDPETMNRLFMERGVSPGGSADLLAVTFFLHFLKTTAKE